MTVRAVFPWDPEGSQILAWDPLTCPLLLDAFTFSTIFSKDSTNLVHGSVRVYNAYRSASQKTENKLSPSYLYQSRSKIKISALTWNKDTKIVHLAEMHKLIKAAS